MQKIFTGKQLPLLYQRALELDGLTGRDHIDRAASAFVQEFVRHYQRGVRMVYVWAGAGRCGAYALRAARLLFDRGYRVSVYLIYSAGKISPEVEELLPLMEAEGLLFTPIYESLLKVNLSSEDVVIDGIFGAELTTPLSGGYQQLIQYLNASKARRVSIEIPSGLFAEENSGNQHREIFRAERTIAFDSPKLAFFFKEHKPYVGEWRHIPLGISAAAEEGIPVQYHLIEDSSVTTELQSRPLEGYGTLPPRVFVPILQPGYAGSALLLARAAQRSGLASLELSIPKEEALQLQLMLPELRITSGSFESYQQYLSSYTAIAVTSGFGTSEQAAGRLQSLLTLAATRPFLLAEDALRLFTKHRELLPLIPPSSILVADEFSFDQLTTRHSSDAERLREAKELAAQLDVCLILRGESTAICLPSGSVLFDVTGNSALSRPGCQQVLYGLIIGLLAQYRSSMTAAMIGVHLHGLAAELYSGKQSQRSLVAGDLLPQISRAYHQLDL